ncbi:YsnF/AvaK domain-containing protein [Dyadobacter flavalbus]|nr:YsnF/AvaK domain-containing protein [Dyadobacter flavalbus]
MSQTVIGIFENSAEAYQAKQTLLNRGFSPDDIDINNNVDTEDSRSTDGQVTDTTDRIGNFFSRLFDTNDESDRYTKAGRTGTIMTVHTNNMQQALDASNILDDYGAVDVNEFESKISGSTAYDSSITSDYNNTLPADVEVNTSNAALLSGSADLNTGSDAVISDEANLDTESIPVIKETIHVGKRSVATGGVRFRSRIIERPVEETIRLRQERVEVDRTPVNRVATEADFANFQEGTIEVTESAEVPVVSKEARVVEEVNVNLNTQEREEVIRDTVRSTEVTAEDLTETDRRNSGNI